MRECIILIVKKQKETFVWYYEKEEKNEFNAHVRERIDLSS